MSSLPQIAVKHKTLERPKAVPPRPVLLPDGEYDATLKCWRLNHVPGEKRTGIKKLELHWQIQSFEHDEPVVLRQFFNVGDTKIGISAGWCSKLMRNYATAFGYPRKQYVNPDHFAGCLLKVSTRTISTGRGKIKLDSGARYSIVEAITDLIAGAPPK